jgi:hypothetical protein
MRRKGEVRVSEGGERGKGAGGGGTVALAEEQFGFRKQG